MLNYIRRTSVTCFGDVVSAKSLLRARHDSIAPCFTLTPENVDQPDVVLQSLPVRCHSVSVVIGADVSINIYRLVIRGDVYVKENNC